MLIMGELLWYVNYTSIHLLRKNKLAVGFETIYKYVSNAVDVF